jgi:hypothetical protein
VQVLTCRRHVAVVGNRNEGAQQADIEVSCHPGIIDSNVTFIQYWFLVALRGQ